MPETPQVIPFPAPALPEAGLNMRGLRVTRDRTTLLDGLDMALAPTGISAIVGPNGAGKSLLLRVIAGLVTPEAGQIALPLPMQGRVGLVFQKAVLLRRTVRGNLTHALRLARVRRRDRADRLAGLLALGNLTVLADRPARQLSGGEAQRLAIIRALAANPLLLMLDEPTAHLDPAATHAVETLTTRIAARGTKVLLVSHDPGQIQRLADEVAFIHRGQCLEVTDKSVFLAKPHSAEARAYLDGGLLL
ncbi:ATP-binding cassette domain-containing protein [Rhodophyticola sp. CCM32]|uniref:ABC transporter ATP-binding protein n=1 Tax=Rhodophyticola sp. CCM32 TaxID=2916397 RepID=UPI00107F4B49|nr:ATP-binding cassette domain-containing protein [Rhodophyticola sp. CCM32]QBY00769.1 ATP-binding cassette domain-containing protein [Rhodophyticola sp. CCM32]